MQHVTVIAEDRTGLIAELTAILAARGINIADIHAQLHGHDAVIQLDVDRFEDTLHALAEESFHVVSDDAVLLRLPDQPGALAGIAKSLADARIDIRSMTVVQRHDGYSVVAVGCNDNDAARGLLKGVVLR